MTLRKGSQSNEAQLIFSYFELENSSDSAKWTFKKIQKSEFFWHLKSQPTDHESTTISVMLQKLMWTVDI